MSPGDNGLMALVGDEINFTAQAQRVLDDKTLAQHLAERAQLSSSARFSASQHALAVQEAYTKLLENKS